MGGGRLSQLDPHHFVVTSYQPSRPKPLWLLAVLFSLSLNNEDSRLV
jgi:hypothetical protein